MKTLIACTVLVLQAAISHGYEFERNPDRFISLGFNASLLKVTGSRSEVDLPGSGLERIQHSREEIDIDSQGVDLRIPVHQSITFTLGADQVQYNQNFDRESGVYKQSSNLDGYRYNIGVRLYFNK